MAGMGAPIEVKWHDTTVLVHEDGSIERIGEGRPIAELVARLRDGPAAAVARDPIIERLVRLLDGRVEAIEASTARRA